MQAIIEQIGEDMMLHLESKGNELRAKLGAPQTAAEYEAVEAAISAGADEELFPTMSHDTILAYRSAVRNGFEGNGDPRNVWDGPTS